VTKYYYRILTHDEFIWLKHLELKRREYIHAVLFDLFQTVAPGTPGHPVNHAILPIDIVREKFRDCRKISIFYCLVEASHRLKIFVFAQRETPEMRKDILANRAMTVLRSPSMVSGAAVSAIRIGPSEDFLTDAGADAAIAVPHFLQNRAPVLTAPLHAGQTTSSLDPHCSQKAASGGLSVSQEGHFIGLGA
jgi:hypothetical protein